MDQIKTKLDDLPDLPFEKILSFLSLKERIRSRAVSRRWCGTIDNLIVKTLCFSSRPVYLIFEKSRWVSGVFAQNFISSPRFGPFFSTFRPSILSGLKHLRLCKLYLKAEDIPAFAQALNLFGQLEELDITNHPNRSGHGKLKFDLELNLPMLKSIQLNLVYRIKKLTLDAPKLQAIRIYCCSNLEMDLVHCESVKKLSVFSGKYIAVNTLKNLRYLFGGALFQSDFTFLSDLQQLKEIHLVCCPNASELFHQKQQYKRADLKIYICGFRLDGPEDLETPDLNMGTVFTASFNEKLIARLAKEQSRMADEIPFRELLYYSAIEGVFSGSEMKVLKRYTDLQSIIIHKPVQDTQRFLNLLKNCNNLVVIEFLCGQPQDLFDRLPEHSAPKQFILRNSLHPLPDLGFIFKLKDLFHICLEFEIDNELVRKAFDELELLNMFWFMYRNKYAIIWYGPGGFQIDRNRKEYNVSDVSAAIEKLIALEAEENA